MMWAPAISPAAVRAAATPRRPERWDRLAHRLAGEIVADQGQSLPGDGRSVVVSRAELTSTGMAVVFLARRSEPPSAVIKLPLTAGAVRGLERETRALVTLHADDRLGAWRTLIPRPCAQGSIDGQAYRVDSVLPGRPVLEPPLATTDPTGASQAAAEAICRLHDATATPPPPDFNCAEVWVNAHLRELQARSAWRRPMALAVERLRDELHTALGGWAGRAGEIHGDYWLGNLLFAEGQAAAQWPAGIIDWDAWAPLELPLHDILHLLLHARQTRTRRELGDVVVRQLRDREWSAAEHQVLRLSGTWSREGALRERHALLLYWLRQTAMHARQQPREVGYRYRLWERRNVLRVVAAL